MASGLSQLEFPWAAPPAPGEVTEVAKGLFWARMPLPFRLNHVNIWLLEEDDGWTVIDTGCATDQLFEVWETLLSGAMGGLPIRRVISTHGHVDHIGLSGWLVERFDAAFYSTIAEWNWARISHLHDVPGADAAHYRHLIRHGIDDDGARAIVTNRGRFIDMATPIPNAIVEIRDGDTIRFGKRDWQVIVTGGHAVEHASFFDAESGILIAGDHILPKISPVVAVYETTPHGDPLADYLSSFPRFDMVPADSLILPSHGMPYRGIHERISQLREHHRTRLETTKGFLHDAKSAFELSRDMFPHVEGPEGAGFALAETIAHVNHLIRQGIVDEVTRPNGQLAFRLRQDRPAGKPQGDLR